MNVFKISASNLEVFLDCPLRYKFKYHDRIPEVEMFQKTNYRAVGTAVHETIRRFIEMGKVEDNPIKIINNILAEEFTKAGLPLPVYEDWTKIMQEWLIRVRLPTKVLGTEKEIDVTLPNGVPVLMYLDLVEELDENTIKVRDWKTGAPYSETDMNNNMQAPMYILGISQLYPGKKIQFYFDFIKDCELMYVYDNDRMKNAVRFIKATYDSIIAMDAEKVEARINKNCGYCGFHDKCPEVLKARRGEFKVNYHTSGDLDTLIKDQLNVSHIEKLIIGEKDRLKQLVLEKMSVNGDTEKVTKEYSAKVTQSRYTHYNVRTVMRAFPDNPEEVLEVKKTAVDKYLPKLPEHIRAEIEDSAENTFSAESLRITAKKSKG